MPRTNWPEDVRVHLAIATVGNSTLMMQSGAGRVERAQSFLRDEMLLAGVATLNQSGFARFLDERTHALAAKLPRPEDDKPNWGAARKVLNIYLRMCAMNKDVNPAFGLTSIESFLELPLDGDAVKGLDAHGGTRFFKKLPDQVPNAGRELQTIASSIAVERGVHRYELDVLYWNR